METYIKTKAETINGKLRTVIRHPFSERVEWVREQLAMGMPVVAEEEGVPNLFLCLKSYWVGPSTKGEYHCYDGDATFGETLLHTVTILPPLPRNPTKDDAWLLYLYASHGLFAYIEGEVAPNHSHGGGEFSGYEPEQGAFSAGMFWIVAKEEITRVVDAEGNKQEVAIV